MVLCPVRREISHFRDVLPSQSLGLILKKLNLTQQKQTAQEQDGKNTQKCIIDSTAQNISDIFPLILQTVIIAQMLSTGGKVDVNTRCEYL